MSDLTGSITLTTTPQPNSHATRNEEKRSSGVPKTEGITRKMRERKGDILYRSWGKVKISLLDKNE